jgi:hypothetical protein
MGWRETLGPITAALPYSLREQIEGYVESVSQSQNEIFRDANVPFSAEIRDRLLFVAGVRRLFNITRSYYWLLDRSLQLLGDDADALALGRARLRRGEGEMEALRKLVNKLEKALNESGFDETFRYESLSDVVAHLYAQTHGPR